MGQNFVIDPNTIEKIVRLAQVSATDNVIEVGPGLGSLSIGILAKAESLTAVEIDARLANQLRITLDKKISTKNLHIINQDFLTIQPSALPVMPNKLVANLPYNLSVPIILHALLTLPSINEYLVMVQSEVAHRICAKSGSRVYGIPSVKIQSFAEAKIVSEISRKAFWPEPNVDSSLVQLKVRKDIDFTHQKLLFDVVDKAFNQRRKMLRSTLKGLLPGETELTEVFDKSQISAQLRAEQLTVADYQKLTTELALTLEP